MKLVNYRCDACEKEYEELFNDSEDQPEALNSFCICGGTFCKYNFKKNCHRVYIADSGGLD